MNNDLKEFLQAKKTIAPMVADLLTQRDFLETCDFDRDTAVLIGKIKRG